MLSTKSESSRELTGSESAQLLADLLVVPIRLFPHRPILPRAFEMAQENNLTVYDALYLALAEEHGAVVFSADDQLISVADRLRLR